MMYWVMRTSRLTGMKHYGPAFLSGAVSSLVLAPFHLVFLCFITFPLLVLMLDGIYQDRRITGRRRLMRVAMTGWSFGFGYFVAGLWWLGHAVLLGDVGASVIMLPLAVVGLPAFLALYWGLATLLQALMWRRGYGRLVALAAAFMLAEWLRAVLFTGFPWNAIGYSAMPTPLWMQIAALVGLDGVNGLAVLLYTTPAMLWDPHLSAKIRAFGVAAGLVVLTFLFGLVRLEGLPAPEILANMQDTNKQDIRVRLVQPSIAQSDKQDPVSDRQNFDKHLQLTRAPPLASMPPPDLIVWPETSVPYILAFVPEAVEAIASSLQQGQLALVGTVRADMEDMANPAYYNALEIVDAQGRIVDHADKAHLVPFGEYLPFQSLFARFGLGAMAEAAGGYTAAKQLVSIALNDRVTILPLICYEAIFYGNLDYEGIEANVMVNISNDAWYGTTPGPAQHFHQARLRSVEQGKSMIRVANNGISAVVDPYGRIIARLALNEVGFVDATIPLETVSTWAGYGRKLPVFCLFFILLTISCNIKTFLSSYKLIRTSHHIL